MNTFVIGDIHGNIEALKSVWVKPQILPGDRLIFLGDYCDRGRGNVEVVDFLIKISSAYECVFLLGNHDAWVRDWMNTGKDNYIWEVQGGSYTVDDYIMTGKLRDNDHLEFWNNLRNSYIVEDPDGDKRLFVHGGWDGKSKFDASDENAVIWDRTLAEDDFEPTEFTKEFYEIYVGHTPMSSGEPENSYNIWKLDTGAGHGGRLTMMDIYTKDYWQS